MVSDFEDMLERMSKKITAIKARKRPANLKAFRVVGGHLEHLKLLPV